MERRRGDAGTVAEESRRRKPGGPLSIESERGGADLHTHSTCSDGVLSPTALVRAAAAADLEAIAITDHDTVAGVAEARLAGIERAVRIAAGVEVSSRCGNREVHVLGLFVDAGAPGLRRFLALQRDRRRQRAERIVDRAAKLKLPLTMRQVEAAAAGAAIGRPHIAAALVEAGTVPDSQTAFARYLGNGRPLAVPKELPRSDEAIDIIHAAGGAAVAAHPGPSRIRDRLLAELAAAGLDGAEIRHPKHGTNREQRVAELCRRLGLLPSGGSDFHGPGRGTARLGEYRVPMNWYEQLRERAQHHRTVAEQGGGDEHQTG